MDKPLTSWLEFADYMLPDRIRQRALNNHGMDSTRNVSPTSAAAIDFFSNPDVRPQQALYFSAAGYLLHEGGLPYTGENFGDPFMSAVTLAEACLKMAISLDFAAIATPQNIMPAMVLDELMDDRIVEIGIALDHFREKKIPVANVAFAASRMLERFGYDDEHVVQIMNLLNIEDRRPDARPSLSGLRKVI